MSERLEKFKEELEYHLSRCARPGQVKAGRAVSSAWDLLLAEGIEPYDLAHAALLASELTMMMETLEERRRFGVYVRDRGISMIRCIDTHWPPVDPNDWPEDWPKDRFS